MCPSEKDSNSCRLLWEFLISDSFCLGSLSFLIFPFVCPLFFCFVLLRFVGIVSFSLWINYLSLDTKRIHCLFPISLRRIFLSPFCFSFFFLCFVDIAYVSLIEAEGR